MEETMNTVTQELENKTPDEHQGGIRRRLRDRDLLRKRKAEAQEKETNQVESQRKRTRAESTRKRGRPRKSDPTLEISVSQEEEALDEEAPIAVAVSEPVEVIPAQPPGSLISLLTVGSGMLESQPTCVLPAPASVPILASVQTPLLFAGLTPASTLAPAPVPANPTLGLVSDSDPVPSPTIVLDTESLPVIVPDPIPVPVLAPAPPPVIAPDPIPFPVLPPVLAPVIAPDPNPVPVLASVPAQFPDAPDAAPALTLSQDPLPAAEPAAFQVETYNTESQQREALQQVLGPDEEEDITPSQDKRADDDDEDDNNTDPSEGSSVNMPEQTKMSSFLTLSSPPPRNF
ncbi:hemogen isoform X2 [Genypterus blacodes]|uniref:hemogen isoform X2 n=1 Tax=Genypterus blacodes TaxID=154954 RepID=UPI003F759202